MAVTRRELLTAAGAAALGLAGRGVFPEGTALPNIVWIMSDDHAAHAIGAYGSRINRTPNIDRLAREGVRFDHCFCTNSLCGPARATLLTGQYSHLHGMIDNRGRFDGTRVTFPKLLQQAGYRTGIVGKWHLGSDPTGFDYWNILPGQGAYHNPVMIEMGTRRTRQGYVTDIITDEAIRFVRDAGTQPFCLLYHHKAPHRGWSPDQKHQSLFEGQTIPAPPTFRDDYRNRASAAAHADMRIADMPDYVKEHPPGMSPDQRAAWNYQRFIKDYLRTIASVDDNVGRFLAFLDEAGLAANTLVVYTSDNGFFLGDHGWFDKRFMYEESLRIPLLIRYPRRTRPRQVERRFVVNIDFAPTLLEAAGLKPPAEMQGTSLLPLLRGDRNVPWRDRIYYHYYEYPQPHRARPHYGLRTERYKLICFPAIADFPEEWELFDLRNDPREMRSIYHDPKHAALVAELKNQLFQLRAQYQDET
ncbi:MAG: sulfatase [Armatimonadota bacterium]|nr:sulfatase [Armatimonadota bacterium]